MLRAARPCRCCGGASSSKHNFAVASKAALIVKSETRQLPAATQAGCVSHRISSCLPQRLYASTRRLTSCAAGRSSGDHWWEKNTPNMREVNGVQSLVDNLADAGDRLVIIDFYAHWCNACRALFPKICKLMLEHPNILFLKVNFEENQQMCKTLGVKCLPFFQLYHGAEGKIDAFTCTVTKLQRFKDAVELYDSPICSLLPNPGLTEFPEVLPHLSDAVANKVQQAQKTADPPEAMKLAAP